MAPPPHTGVGKSIETIVRRCIARITCRQRPGIGTSREHGVRGITRHAGRRHHQTAISLCPQKDSSAQHLARSVNERTRREPDEVICGEAHALFGR